MTVSKGGTAVRQCVQLAVQAAEAARRAERDATVAAVHAVDFELVLGSANICTSLAAGGPSLDGDPESHGLNLTGRLAELEELFDEHGVDLLAVQEGRMPIEQRMEGARYIMFMAAALGKYRALGVQVWVRRRLAGLVLAVRVISPRIMYIDIRIQGAKRRFFSVHAPTERATDEEIEDFYSALRAQLRALPANISCWLQGDFNARVGSMPSETIGPFHAERENRGGMEFRALLEEYGLFAANTHFGNCDATTWQHTSGAQHRIDYSVLDLASFTATRLSAARHDIDMSVSTRIDHWPVLTVLELGRPIPPTLGLAPPRRVKWSAERLRDLGRLERFRAVVDALPQPSCEGAEPYLNEISTMVRDAAEPIFGEDRAVPRKHCITGGTWQLVKAARKKQAGLRTARARCRALLLVRTWRAWRCRLQAVSGECRDDGVREAREFRLLHAQCLCHAALALQELEAAQRTKRAGLEHDRHEQWLAVAQEAEAAAADNDMGRVYGLVKRLGAYKPRTLPGVQRPDGELAASPAEEMECWENYFAELLVGTVVDQPPEPAAPEEPAPAEVVQALLSIDLTLDNIAAILAKLCKRKSPGPDNIPAEVWRAGGDRVVGWIREVLLRVVRTGLIPVAWRGGRLVKLYKKGAVSLPSNHRGLLVGDHVAKIFTAVIAPPVADASLKHLPMTQCGCMKGRGTSRASHLSKSFLLRCKRRGRPAAALFIDLSKAFDKVVRETIFGLQAAQTRSEVEERLMELDLEPRAVVPLTDYIWESGGKLHELGVPTHLVRLVAGLHEGTWFKLDGSLNVIATRLGSRQGCTFGALVFNLAYGRALSQLQDRLGDLFLTLPCDTTKPPWAPAVSAEAGEASVSEATYVDDEVVLLEAGTNAELRAKLARTLEVLAATFAEHGLHINWAPGKTELIIAWRGPFSKRFRQETVVDGVPAFAFGDGMRCLVVGKYKHVGTMLSQGCSETDDITTRLAKASAVFNSLAAKVLTQPAIRECVRLALFRSLVLSVLLFGSEHWVLTTAQLGRINVVMMRWLRRILRQPRAPVPGFKRISDEEVRHRAGVFSVESLIQQRRLTYARSIVCNPLPPLHALLQDAAGVPGSWPQLLLSDLRMLRAALPEDRSLGDPADCPADWAALLASSRRAWKFAARRLQSHASALVVPEAVTVDLNQAAGEGVPAFVCMMCPREAARSFNCNKGLRTHMMRAHGVRKASRGFIPAGSSTCPACAKVFESHARALDHLEYRAMRCRAKMFDGTLVPVCAAGSPC